MTATNSFTVLDMAKEVMNYDPDLLLVYDGHNEFYGALGISSHESIGKYRWLTMLNLQMIHVKTFMLLRDLYATITTFLHHTPASRLPSTLMETLAFGQYIPFGSDEYNSCLDIFKANLIRSEKPFREQKHSCYFGNTGIQSSGYAAVHFTSIKRNFGKKHDALPAIDGFSRRSLAWRSYCPCRFRISCGDSERLVASRCSLRSCQMP